MTFSEEYRDDLEALPWIAAYIISKTGSKFYDFVHADDLSPAFYSGDGLTAFKAQDKFFGYMAALAYLESKQRDTTPKEILKMIEEQSQKNASPLRPNWLTIGNINHNGRPEIETVTHSLDIMYHLGILDRKSGSYTLRYDILSR
ncbi:MAG: hypothetical protein KKF44_10905 [Nanoarchaeota archaeon]|nr:hypothetical protein [Nanoarchaeota archaeon]